MSVSMYLSVYREEVRKKNYTLKNHHWWSLRREIIDDLDFFFLPIFYILQIYIPFS